MDKLSEDKESRTIKDVKVFDVGPKEVSILIILVISVLIANNIIPNPYSEPEVLPPIPRIPLDVNAMMEP